MAEVKAYFFDWGRTLGTSTYRNIVRDLAGEEVHNLMMVGDEGPLPQEHREKVFSELSNSEHRLYEDSECFIMDLKSKGYYLGIVSNMFKISADRIRKLFPEFLDMFDVTTFSSEVRMRKPGQGIFLYTLNKLNEKYDVVIKPREIVMIGDKMDKDMRPALALRMQARLIDRDNQNLSDMLK